MPQQVTCPICGRPVAPPRRTYCSAACAADGRKARKRVTFHRKKPGGPVYYPRTCPDCGQTYQGHIKSVRCPDCQAEANQRHNAEYARRKRSGHTRPIGSTDLCQRCGQPYTVASGLQRYCPACAHVAVLDNVRAASAAWNRAAYASPEAREAKNAKRRKAWNTPRPCALCGKLFVPVSPAQQLCSDACRTARRKQLQHDADARRAEKRSAQAKARRQEEHALPQAEQEQLRLERNAKARAAYARRKARKSP